jgi:predicted transcriptional regulator
MSHIPLYLEKHKQQFIIKIILFILSLFLLFIITLFLVIFYDPPFFDPNLEFIRLVLLYLLIPTLAIVLTLTALTVLEYKNFFIRRSYFKEGRSYLSLADIFQNENRLNILTQILNNPGIHHNEILRNCSLNKGQLQWHLDTLLKHHVIKKEKFGQYTIYFPITSSKEAIETFKRQFSKSKTTLEVLNTITKNPGINSAELSRLLNLSRNSIKHHIDKLLEQHYIRSEKKGRINELYLIYP